MELGRKVGTEIGDKQITNALIVFEAKNTKLRKY